MPVYPLLPPDVNSARLNGGPGVGSQLLSATTYETLGAVVTDAAAELTASLTFLAAAGWQGPTGAAAAASFLPHAAWMVQEAATLVKTGASQTAAAAAFQAAVLATPTVPNIAENQLEHVTLQSTNILGINTIPIASNRTMYGTMWTEAGAAMEGYQAAGATAAVPLPATVPPPVTTGAGAISTAVGIGISAATGGAVAAMSAAGTVGSAAGGAASAAGTVAPLAAQAGQGAQAAKGGTMAPPGTPGTATPGKEDPMAQLTQLASSAPQAASSLPQAAQAPLQAGQGVISQGQGLISPLQSAMSGSGLGSPATPGMGGMNPGMMPNAFGNHQAERSAIKPAGVTRGAGLGGVGSGYKVPSGWRAAAESFGTSPAAGPATGRGGTAFGGLGAGAQGAGGAPGMFPGGAGAHRGSESRYRGGSIDWDEDPFGVEDDDDLPLTLAGGRGS